MFGNILPPFSYSNAAKRTNMELRPVFLLLSFSLIHSKQADLSHYATGCGNVSLSCPPGSVIFVENSKYSPDIDCQGGTQTAPGISGQPADGQPIWRWDIGRTRQEVDGKVDVKNEDELASKDDISMTVWAAIVAKCSGNRGPTCKIHLGTDLPKTLSGGRLDVRYSCGETINSYCGGNVQVETGGYITTPGYPKYYLGGKECTWNLMAAEGQKVQISLLDSSLRGEDCIQIMDNDKLQVEECAQMKEQVSYTSQGNAIQVRMNLSSSGSQQLFPRRGILARYRPQGCPIPGPIADGQLKFRNGTSALFVCNEGHVFRSSLTPFRTVQCRDGNWVGGVEHCVSVEFLLQYGDEKLVRSLRALPVSHSQLLQAKEDSEWEMEMGATILVGCLLAISLIIGISIFFKYYDSGSYYVQEDMISLQNMEKEEPQEDGKY